MSSNETRTLPEDTPEGPSPNAGRNCGHRTPSWAWPLALICVTGIIAAALVAWQIIRSAGDTAAGIQQIAERFKSGSITRTWQEEVTRIAGSRGQPLEVGTIETTVHFSVSSELRVLWSALSLGTTTTEITVPATYRYHVRLTDDWQLETRGSTCLVRAPRIRPTLPVAFDTSRMSKRTEKGWARIGHKEQMAAQEAVLTPHLNSLAESKIPLVREESRKVVADFVRQWLLREDQWQNDRFSSIKVIFADEKDRSFAEVDPTITLE